MASLPKTVKKLIGLSGADYIIGSSAAETIYGLAGDDRLKGAGGNDIIYGGVGRDTAIFSGNFADYNFSNPTGGLQVTHARGTKADGSDFVSNDVELLQFNDITIDLTINHQPVAVNDVNGTDLVIERGGVNNGTAGDATATGNALSNDTDIEQTLGRQTLTISNPGVRTGVYGTLTVNANGTWTYTLLDNDADTQGLKAGQVAQDVFSYTVSDGAGGTATGQITISIKGANDAPVAVADSNGSDAVTEAGGVANGLPGDPNAAGNVLSNDTDVDNGDTKTVTTTGVRSGTYGTLTLNANGSWSYVLDNTRVLTQGLTAGQAAVDVFSYTMKDAAGAMSTSSLTINIKGTNDNPVITSGASAAQGSVTEAGNLDNGAVVAGTASVTKTLTSSDVDNPNTATWSGNASGMYGSFAINSANGQWTYTLDNTRAATQALKEGESKTETFTATVTDDKGATATQTVTITVNGTNDSPVAVADSGGTTENAVVLIDVLANDTDVDAGHAFTLVGVSVPAGQGSASIVSNQLQYSPGNAFDYLAAGEQATATVTYTMRDEFAATSSSTVTITVTGTNDAPTVSAYTNGDVTEDTTSPSLTDSGTITFDDIDLTDAHTTSVVAAGGNTLGGTLTASVTTAAAGAGAGEVTWNYSVSNAATQYLRQGQTATETFTVTIDDGHSGGTVSQNITITVTGTNDGPVLSDTVDPGAVTELVDASAQNIAAISGTFAVSDADVGDTLTASVVGSPVVLYNGNPIVLPAGASALIAAGAFTVTGATSNGGATSIGYTYDPGAANLDFLDSGGALTITYSVKVNDGTADSAVQNVTITINGTNDAPVAVADSASATEGQPPFLINVLANDTDVDAGHAFTLVSVSVPAGQGSASIVSNQLQYSPGNAFDYLAQGEQATATVTYTMRDEFAATSSSTVTITVTGTNDAPTVSAYTNGDVTEDTTSPSLTDSGTITFDDIDLTDAHTTSVVAAGGNTLGGTLTASVTTAAAGAGAGEVTWNYSVSNAATQYLRQGQTATETFTVTIDDGHSGGTVSQNITITVTGTNDGPVLSDTVDPGAVTELVDASAQNIAAISGTFAVSDADVGDTLTASVVGSPVVLYNGNPIVLPAGAAALIAAGAFTVTGATSNGGATSIGYTYDPGAANLDFLDSGGALTITYSVKVNDGTADSAVQNVTITINGTNDAPVAVADTLGTLTYTYVGYYAVYDGPDWGTNPETYSGVEAAALVFGGSPADYAISTIFSLDPATITHTAWYDGWGEHGGMQFADTYELDTGAPGYAAPGGSATARSAYVRDGLPGSTYRNYVWRESNTGSVTNEDSAYVIAAATLLANDTDADANASLTVSAVSALSASGASVTLNGSNITYDPTTSAAMQALDDGETLTDTFTYTISDGNGGTSSATVTLTVAGRNDAPTVVALATTITENDTVSVNLLAGASDVDVEALSVNGTPASVTTTGGRTLTAGVDYTVAGATFNLTTTGRDKFNALADGASDSLVFNFGVTDGTATTPNSLTVHVNGVNDAPQFTNEPFVYTISENNAVGAAVGTVTATDPDIGDSKYFEFANGTQTSGFFNINRNTGAITANAALDYEATATHYYDLDIVVRDRSSGGLTDTSTVRVNVGDVAEGIGYTPDLITGGYYEGNGTGQPRVVRGLIDTTGDGYVDAGTATQLLPPVGPYIVYQGMTAGDINGDGRPDFAVSSGSSATQGIYINRGDTNGDGTADFTLIPVVAQSATQLYAVEIGDVDGDGRQDVVFGKSYSGPTEIFYNLGDTNADGLPEFQSKAVSGSVIGYAEDLDLGDINGDGRLDIISGGYAGNAELLINRGDTDSDGRPNFTSVALTGSDYYSLGTAVGDFNNDGKLDVFLAGWGTNEKIAMNTGDANSDGIPEFITANIPSGSVSLGYNLDVAVADVNGDGRLDAVVSDYDYGARIYYNLGDTTGDSIPEFSVQVLAAYGPTYGVTVGDINNDGLVDIAWGRLYSTAQVATNIGDTDSNGQSNFVVTSIAGTTGTFDLEFLKLA